jgi:hypothetical protein
MTCIQNVERWYSYQGVDGIESLMQVARHKNNIVRILAIAFIFDLAK